MNGFCQSYSSSDRATGAVGESVGLTIELRVQAWRAGQLKSSPGDFAIAHWDGDEVRAVRDVMGPIPLYYAQGTDGSLWIASDPVSILDSGVVARDLDEHRIADYLAACFDNRARTFHRQIRCLPPGHELRWRPGSDPVITRFDRLQARSTSGDPVDAFRDTFRAAIATRLPADKRCGLFLSGGLDSTGLLGAGLELAVDWTAVSATFPDFASIDETAQIDVACRGVVPGFAQPVDQLSALLLDDPAVYETLGEPFQAPNFFVHWALLKASRRHGVRVLFDGLDGDTTVNHGMDYLTELCFSGQPIRALMECARVARRMKQSRLRWCLRHALLPLFRGMPSAASPWPRFLRRDFARRIGWEPTPPVPPAHTLQEIHRRQLESGVLSHYMTIHHRSSAAFGISPRHPFHDRHLAELCLGLPGESRLHDGWDRWVQRQAFRDWAPESIRWRQDKSYWEGCFRRSFLEHDRHHIERLLASDLLGDCVDLPAVRSMWQRQPRTDSELFDLWLITSLAAWLESRQTRRDSVASRPQTTEQGIVHLSC